MAIIRYANQVGSRAHVECMRTVKPGDMEYQVGGKYAMYCLYCIVRHPQHSGSGCLTARLAEGKGGWYRVYCCRTEAVYRP